METRRTHKGRKENKWKENEEGREGLREIPGYVNGKKNFGINSTHALPIRKVLSPFPGMSRVQITNMRE